MHCTYAYSFASSLLTTAAIAFIILTALLRISDISTTVSPANAFILLGIIPCIPPQESQAYCAKTLDATIAYFSPSTNILGFVFNLTTPFFWFTIIPRYKGTLNKIISCMNQVTNMAIAICTLFAINR